MTRDDSPAVRPPSGTVTFLFSDIEGSTQRWARNRVAMQEAVRAHDRLMHNAIAAHAGYVFKTVGDAFCVAFATPESAASAALAAQLALRDADFSGVDGLSVRMAIHLGTADERDGDYFGPAVNRVARLLSLGHGGQVLLSAAAADLLRDNAPPHIALADLGTHALKDLAQPERVSQLVAPGLQSNFPKLRGSKEAVPWMVPEAMRTRYFTGRDELLARLRRQLVEQHRAALSGLGGVGKTQTALEYAMRYRADYPGGVFWVNAETIGGLTGGFAAIAATLRLPHAESNEHDQVVRAVFDWLNANAGWLLILDNVQDRREVQPFVPAHGAGDVLITSRESVFAELGMPRALELCDLDAAEGVRFLLARTGRERADAGDRAAANALAAELGNLPLALEQAAAYIAETDATFFAYLVAFRKRRVTLLEKAGGLVGRDTVAVTWAPNFEAVERASPAAVDVLRIGAVLAPDAIPFELFLDGASAMGGPIAAALADPDDMAMAEVLQPLARYSLVRSDAILRAFSVHRLVQEIVWAALAQFGRRTYVERAVHAIDAAFPAVEYAAWAQCERFVPHVASIVGWVDAGSVQLEPVGRILNQTGLYLCERGRYSEAQPLHEQALAIRERALGPEHPDVATSLSNLATVHFHRGRDTEALPLYERALAIRERALGPEHPEVASSLNNLGAVHHYRGRFTEAQAVLERVIAIQERALGPDHPKVAQSLNNLGVVYEDQGLYAEAQAQHERSLAIRERVLGPDHPKVAHTLNGLAETHLKRGQYAQAQPLLERALAIGERALGPEHSDVAHSLIVLGETYAKQGRYSEAQTLFARVLAILESALGPEHSGVARSLTDLANMYVRLGRDAEAEPLFERALAIGERVLGPNHPEVAQTLIGLASLRTNQRRDAEAIALYERAAAIKARTFRAGHPELVELQNTIEALNTTIGADTASA